MNAFKVSFISIVANTTYVSYFYTFRDLLNTEMTELKKVTHTFLSGKMSSTVIIPISVARKYGLDKPSNVVVEETEQGILIRRINL